MIKNLSRRKFLGAAASVTASSYAAVKGANDRLLIGVVGCGGMASGHMRMLMKNKAEMNIDIVAVCDLWDKRAEAAAALTGGKPLRDYRQLLAMNEIDYVLNATPEHWHARIIIDAASAGKHLYSEKPMTRTVEQAKQVVACIRKTGVKLQVGVQGMSDDSYETAYRYVKDGVLGKVVLAQIDYSRNHRDDFWIYKTDPDIKPGVDFDWTRWQGYTKKRPFDPERYFSWRRFWDYSGGIAGDLFVHRVTRMIKALGLTFPEMACAAGGKFQFTTGKAEIPDTINILLDYPGGPTLQLISSQANDTKVPHLIRGHRATLEFTPTGFTITPQKLYEQDMKPIVHVKTGAEDTKLHHQNLQDAIRRGAALKCDEMLGYYGVVASEMGCLSLRWRKYVKWNKQGEKIARS
jgi:predicted dehydrogenase